MEEEEVTQTEIAEEVVDNSEEATTEVDWKAEFEKKDQAFRDQQARAAKAEKALKESIKPKEAETQRETESSAAPSLSTKDILALSSKNVSEDEDIDWLTNEVAPLYEGSIAKALSNKLISDMLEARREERQTAQASSTGSGRRTVTDRSPQSLLSAAQKGQLPESKQDIQKLIRARIGIEK